jgi:hypothetical protein
MVSIFLISFVKEASLFYIFQMSGAYFSLRCSKERWVETEKFVSAENKYKDQVGKQIRDERNGRCV